jgi:hypothetical protein
VVNKSKTGALFEAAQVLKFLALDPRSKRRERVEKCLRHDERNEG